jgi:hypothetical protein
MLVVTMMIPGVLCLLCSLGSIPTPRLCPLSPCS